MNPNQNENARTLYIWLYFAQFKEKVISSEQKDFLIEVSIQDNKQRSVKACVNNQTLKWSEKLQLPISDSLLALSKSISIEFKLYHSGHEEPFAKAFLPFHTIVLNDIAKEPLRKSVDFYSLELQIPVLTLDIYFSYYADPEKMLENKDKRPRSPFTLAVTPKSFYTHTEVAHKLYLIAEVGSQAFQTEKSQNKVSKANPLATWDEIIPFKITDEHLLTFRVFQKKGQFIGWVVVSLQDVWYNMRNSRTQMSFELKDESKNTGSLECVFEIIPHVFSSNIHIYPLIELTRGTSLLRKIQFLNPAKQPRKKEIIIRESNEYITIKNSILEIPADAASEIKMQFTAPPAYKMERIIIDVCDQSTREIDESLVFNVLAL